MNYPLAHQWMAAYLNTLSIQNIGGSIPAGVQAALDHGAYLLDLWDGSEAGKSPDLKGQNAKTIHADFVGTDGILADFNEGETGPGHCDEPIVDPTLTASPVLFLPVGILASVIQRLRRRRR